MKENRYRRFTPTEVILHALHAVIYLVLLVTGVILWLQRTLENDWISPRPVSLIHRIVGIVLVIFLLQVLFLSVIAPSFRIIWRTISEAFNWGLRDFIWLVKVPFHFLIHKITLPPSGRFNPGQKLNILVILITVTGLSLSGIWMIIVPDALVAWYIHIVCFKLGLIFLALHLYLTLVNPSTRKSITGMITGYVSLQYMKVHHPLCLEEQVSKEHHIHVHRLPAVLVGFVISFVLLLGIYLYGPERFTHQAQKWAQSRGMLSLMPGSLTSSHAEVITDQECLKCHNLENRSSSDKCIVCHELIAERIRDNSGYHGGFTGVCTDCHKEHQGLYADIRPFDKDAFNHRQANFHLIGKHAELDCEQCHKMQSENTSTETIPAKIRYIGIEYETCSTCHEDSHNGQMSHTCSTCHSEQGWKGKSLVFSHNEHASYPLDTLHAALSCDSCHQTTAQGVLYRPLEKKCESCHSVQSLAMQGITTLQKKSLEPDPHWKRVACTDCHDTSVANQSTRDYANRCVACHNEDYGQLYYNWLKTVDDHISQADEKVPDEIIKQIEAIGFHHIRLSTSLWKDTIKNGEDKSDSR